jgi:hypothetical protein
VGTITAVEGNLATVTCVDELPANLEPLYLRRIEAGRELRIHVLRDVQRELEEAIAPIEAIEKSEGADWAALKTLSLALDGVRAGDRERIRIGQPVHLDITGAELTGFAFDTAITGFGRYMVTLGVCLFGFSTMLSWSYYRAILPYKFTFVIFVFLGMVLPKFQTVYDFSDATTGLMVLCNLPAVLILSPVVLRAAREYFRKLDAGEFPRWNRTDRV